jgi:hypothetical protein
MHLERTALCLLMAVSLVLIAGCKEKTPMEKAVDKVKGTTEKTSDAVTDAAKKVGEGAEKAYDKTKDAVKDGAQAVTDGVKKGVEKTGEAFDKAGEKIKELGK